MMDERPGTDELRDAPAPAAADGTDTVVFSGDGGLRDQVIEMLMTVFDPEIPVNIHELGLIYGIDVSEDGDVVITMTLTTPNCPVAGSMPGEVQSKVGSIPGVRHVDVNLVWEPPWTPERMSEAAKLELGFI